MVTCDTMLHRPALETRISGLNLNSTKFEDHMAKRKTADMEEFKALKGLNIFYQVCGKFLTVLG